MRLLLKIGGAQLEEPEPRARLCDSIAAARKAGHEILIVHGGGNQIRTVGRQLGLTDRYHEGLRITDEATADVALMVLAGKVNRTLTASLQRAGVPAVGICGADGDSFLASRLEHDTVDLGYVGKVAGTSSRLVRTLLSNDFVPVIATVAPGVDRTDGPFYNLNADTAASPLCRSFACEAMIFLTDVDGVMNGDGEVQRELTLADCDQLMRTGAVRDGMVPKLEAAMLALRHRVAHLITIAPAGADDCVLAALRPGHGTRFVMTGSDANTSGGGES